ncbi:MAG: tetratricopeptide repeat protein [Candidatus Latescibacterota bacterium]|nr:MAG: tetratricopeptide repeat protein [Candidatus Latescibacterota bacterium]
MKNAVELSLRVAIWFCVVVVGFGCPATGIPGRGAACAASETPAPDPRKEAEALADYTVGVFLLESGSARAAITHLESAWEKSAHDAHIGEKLAEAYFSVGELGQCEPIVDELIAKDENSFHPVLLKAKILYLRSFREEALTYLERLDAHGEPSFEVQRILATIYTELGRERDALEAYGKAVRIERGHPFLHYQYGLLLKKFNRNDEAVDAFVNAAKLRPGFSEAVMAAAEIMIGNERYQEAESLLEELLDVNPDNYEAVKLISDIYIEKGELDRAIRLLDLENRRSRLPHDGILRLGRLYYEAGNYDNALDIFQSLFEKNDNSPELARVLGEISARAGKSSEALSYYREAIRLGPQDYRNHLALFFASSSAFTPEDTERIELSPDEGARLLDAAAAVVRNDDFEGLYLVGISYQSIDSLPSALEFLNRANRVRANDERVLLNLAAVLEKMERYEDAEPHLAALHDLQPTDPTTCNFYGYLLALMGTDLEKAERLILTALEQDPENGYYIDSLGWVYFMGGDYDRAVVELEKASSLVRDDPVILEHLGDVYTALDRLGDALSAYEKSMELRDDATDIDEIRKKIDATRKRLGE